MILWLLKLKMQLFIKENKSYMLKNFIKFIYISFNAFLCLFILFTVNFIIVSDERMEKHFTEIILKKIAYALIVDLLSIFLSYILYQILKKYLPFKNENKKIIKYLFIIYTIVSVISLLAFVMIVK